jgi:biopolymer transport protein ExbD
MSATPEDFSDDAESDPIKVSDRPPIDAEMDITPMIDMTFLLLIFFVLTSKMTGEKSYEIPPAKHGSLVPTKNCVSIIVSRGSGDVPIVANGDGILFSDDPDQQVAEIGEYVQLELESGRKSEILIRAEGNVTAGQLYKVKQAIAEVIEENKLLHIAVQEMK